MGYVRFFLAIAVLTSHTVYHGWQGRMAVFGFYILSGFLITLISNEIYNKGTSGKCYFLANRFLRIYPGYWACALIGMLCIAEAPVPIPIPGMTALPATWQEWLPNLTIFGLNYFHGGVFFPRIVATGWSLSIELVYYLILGLVTARHKRLTLLCLIITGIVTSYTMIHGTVLQAYGSIYAPAPLFFLGSLLYHYRDDVRRWCTQRLLILLCLLTIMLYSPDITGFSSAYPHGEIYALYLSSMPMAYFIICSYHIGRVRPTTAIEQFLADVSYPMFLLHWPLSRVAYHYVTGGYAMGWGMLAIGLVVTFITAGTVVLCIDTPLKRLRQAVRKQAIEVSSAT